MNVYFVYIHNLPDNVYKDMDGSVLLPKLEYDEQNKLWMGFYGFTKNKKILNEFMEIHDKKYFIVKKKKLTKEEYFNYKKEKLGYLISLNKFRVSKNKTYKLATTNDEHMYSTENCEDIILNKMEEAYLNMVSDLKIFNHRFFEEKYRDLLEKIYYGTYFDLLCGDESMEDFACYQLGFGKTSEGNYDMKVMYNTFQVFITMYYNILQK